MPSQQALPKVTRLVNAGSDGIVGSRDRYADTRSGSIVNHVAGPMALLLYRESDADRDVFRAIYLDDADGDDLTTLVQGRFGIARALDTPGTGTVTLARSSAAAGAGTFLAGSRIQLANGLSASVYLVAADTAVAASQTVASAPIQSLATGMGTAASATVGLSLLDVAYDPLWTPVSLTCSDGTAFEAARDYRARVRQTLTTTRNGYLPELLSTVQAVGAKYLVVFTSQQGLASGIYTDDDYGVLASSITYASGVYTVTTQAAHGLQTGQCVTIKGATARLSARTQPAYWLNSTFQITVTSPVAFTFPLAYQPMPYHDGAIVVAGAQADYGLNAAYVADANCGSSSALVAACQVALEGSRGLGADLWVGGIALSALSLSALVTLRDDPSKFNLVALSRKLAQTLVAQFTPTGSGYTFKAAALGGAMAAADPSVQFASFPYAWAASTAYTLGALVYPSTPTGLVYQCTSVGTSGTVQPAWTPVLGATVADGSVGWTAVSGTGLGVFVAGVQQSADPSIVPGAWPATLPRYSLSPQAISFTFAGPI